LINDEKSITSISSSLSECFAFRIRHEKWSRMRKARSNLSDETCPLSQSRAIKMLQKPFIPTRDMMSLCFCSVFVLSSVGRAVLRLADPSHKESHRLSAGFTISKLILNGRKQARSQSLIRLERTIYCVMLWNKLFQIFSPLLKNISMLKDSESIINEN
jgi:hypothetical protein